MAKLRCGYTIVFIVAFSSLFKDSRSDTVPSFIKPCDDTSSDCLKKAIQTALPGFIKGVPELGIDTLDPFKVDKLELTLPGALKIEFRQGIAKGLKKCAVDSASLKGDTLDVQFRCNLTIKGKYKSSGRMLVFSLNGDGDAVIKCKDLNFRFIFKLGSAVGSNGNKYLKVKNFEATHSFDGQVSYRMTNLIKGNPELSNLVLGFMNRNWRIIADDFGKPIVDFGVNSVFKNIKKLFEGVPLQQLIKAPVNFN